MSTTYTTIQGTSLNGNWPEAYGASGTLGIFCTQNFTADDGRSYIAGAGNSLRLEFVTESVITVTGGTGTYASYQLPTTDTSTPNNIRYFGVVFDARGGRRDVYFEDRHLLSTLGTSISELQWANSNAAIFRRQIDGVYTQGQTDLAIAAAVLNAALNQDYVIGSYSSLAVAVAAMPATGATLVINQATTCTANLSVPAYVTLRFTHKGYIIVTNSVTLTIVGPIEASPRKIFYNANSGQGTVSLAGNKSMSTLSPLWWGVVADNSTDDAAPFQACLDAADSRGGAIIQFTGGTICVGTTITVPTSGTIMGISLLGVTPTTSTTGATGLRWTGSTSGKMLKMNRDKYAVVKNIRFSSAVALGTTIGIWLTGPGSGEQTGNIYFENNIITGFHIGVQGGDVGAVAAAGEIVFEKNEFTLNDIGWLGASSGNTLIIMFSDNLFTSNNTYGLQLGTGSGDTHIRGGGFSANSTRDIALSLGWNGAVHVDGARFEVGDGLGVLFGGIENFGNTGSCIVHASRFKSGVVPNYAMLKGDGIWEVDGCNFGAEGQDGWIVYDTGSGNPGGSLAVKNSLVQTTAGVFNYFTASSGDVGFRYYMTGNSYVTGGGARVHLDDQIGIIGATPAGVGTMVNTYSLSTSGGPTATIQTLTNQDATPSVKYGTFFKTANSGATLYTNFLNPVENHAITIFVNDANTSFENNATIVTGTGANITAVNGAAYTFIYFSSKWRRVL